MLDSLTTSGLIMNCNGGDSVGIIMIVVIIFFFLFVVKLRTTPAYSASVSSRLLLVTLSHL